MTTKGLGLGLALGLWLALGLGLGLGSAKVEVLRFPFLVAPCVSYNVYLLMYYLDRS